MGLIQYAIGWQCYRVEMTNSIPWSQIDTVLFDMDGTLLDLHYDNHFWQEYIPLVWGEREGVSLDEAKAILHPKFVQHYGSLQWYCTDFWSEQLDLDVIALKADINHLINIRPSVEEFLLWLKQQGKAIWLTTNAHGNVLDLKMAETGLAKWFDHLLTSHQFGHAKEKQAFWHAMQEQFPFDPSRTIFFDDSIPVLRSAQDYGIAHVVQMLHPDSKRKPNTPNFELAIHDFDELMP